MVSFDCRFAFFLHLIESSDILIRNVCLYVREKSKCEQGECECVRVFFLSWTLSAATTKGIFGCDQYGI